MTTKHINGVKMINAAVEVDQQQCLAAYEKRCADRAEFARTGAPFGDKAFRVNINGHDRPAYMIYECEDMYGHVLVARYLCDTDRMGDWYDLIVIDVERPGHAGNQVEFSPRQLIRNFGELMAINNNLQLGMAIDASALIRRY